MRNMSFALTTNQIKNRTKTVTRRLGWSFLKPGDRLMAVEKAQGIKKGELKRLHPIEVTAVYRQPLCDITKESVVKEGFPKMTPDEFIKFFCECMGVKDATPVTVIEFKHL
jgi:hypothetical protein